MSILEWMKKVARKTLDQRHVAETTTAPPSAPPSASPDDAARDGRVSQRYDNLGEIARGGMGAILSVRDRDLQRKVAMKVLEPCDGKTSATRDALFVEEAQITSQLEHPNICPIHELGRDEHGTPYFTMKLVKGETFSDFLHDGSYQATNPRSLRAALDVLLRVCDALAFAHAKGVIHRDLKPENVMVGDFGQVYLMDFGVARVVPVHDGVLTSGGAAIGQGMIVGTLMYMPPEQAQGGVVDARSDVFGLGAMLYEILTQCPPYFAESLGDLVLMAQGAKWTPPQERVGPDEPLPSALCAICEKALSANPNDRYQSVSALKEALEEFLVGGVAFPTRTVPIGECIVHEGDAGECAFIIQRGFCRVFKHVDGQQLALTDLGPGDVFGEAAVFASTTRTATVQALTDVTLQVVNRDVFEKDLGMASAMGAFVKAIAARFVSTDAQLRATQNELQSALRNSNAPLAVVERARSGALGSPAQQLDALMRSSPALVLEALTRGAQAIAREQAPSCEVKDIDEALPLAAE
jgi:CRP-like cAMP-binding protein